jgi:superfamily II DNA or RNA helicase
MQVTLDTHIRYKMWDTDWDSDAQIREALTVPNPDYEMARRERLPGWRTMPSVLRLWREEGRGKDAVMVLPRGFLPRLLRGLSAKGVTPTLIDGRIGSDGSPGPSQRPTLRPDQVAASQMMAGAESGILQAPPGAGKTVVALNLIVTRMPACVIVNTTNIAAQWRDRAKEHFGLEAGLVGDGSMNVRPLTIALQQTLWSRREEFDQMGWWDQFATVVLDECHHAPAETYTEVLQRFPARYRLGLSATPERKAGQLALAEAIIGPIAHEVDRRTLLQAGVLVHPMVLVMKTNFDFPYYSTGSDDDGKFRRNNYTPMMEALVRDDNRNQIVADAIGYEYSQGAACLVVSRRLEHMERLKRMVGFDRCFMLTGAQDTAERMRIAREADEGPCVIFSTIADEAVDIPRLDRIFLPWPTRLTSLVRQQIGRIERAHPNKKDAVVYDFFDIRIDPLRSQFRLRRKNIYDAEGMLCMFQDLASDLKGQKVATAN